MNISRTRRLINQTNINNLLVNDLNDLKFSDVKLSVLADIGRASFIYDMRNIKEVFVFPKIWYRRSLARRVFLGEEPITTVPTSSSAYQFQNSTRNSQTPPSTPKRRTSISSTFTKTKLATKSSTLDSPMLSDEINKIQQSKLQRTNEYLDNQNRFLRKKQNETNEKNVLHNNNSSNWQTLVLVSINLSELEVKMNVGNVMGHVR